MKNKGLLRDDSLCYDVNTVFYAYKNLMNVSDHVPANEVYENIDSFYERMKANYDSSTLLNYTRALRAALELPIVKQDFTPVQLVEYSDDMRSIIKDANKHHSDSRKAGNATVVASTTCNHEALLLKYKILEDEIEELKTKMRLITSVKGEQ